MELATIRIRAEQSMIPPTLSMIEDLAVKCGLNGENLIRLRLETEEAMDSVINYGFCGSDNGHFDVSVVVDNNEFSVVIRDKGKPFDYDLLEKGDAASVASGRILKGMTEGPKLTNMGRMGREQSITKKLPSTYAISSADENSNTNNVVPEFDIHKLKKSESIEVSQCLYDEFGYSYPYEAIYYPEKYFDACEKGNFYSLVATANNGEVAGHLGLIFSPHFPGTAEISMGVTKHKYRNFSLMSKLTQKITEHAYESGLTSYFAMPVGYHPYTQKISIKQGMNPCAAILNYINSDISVSYRDAGYRRSVFVCTKILKEEHRDIFISDEINDLISFVIECCKLDRTIKDGSEPTCETTSMNYEINPVLLLGKMYIDNIGTDFPKIFKSTNRIFKDKLCETVELYINASDPAAPFAYEEAKKHGYFCVGLFPSADSHDYIVMLNIIYSVVNYDELDTIEPFTTLASKIRKLDPYGGE